MGTSALHYDTLGLAPSIFALLPQHDTPASFFDILIWIGSILGWGPFKISPVQLPATVSLSPWNWYLLTFPKRWKCRLLDYCPLKPRFSLCRIGWSRTPPAFRIFQPGTFHPLISLSVSPGSPLHLAQSGNSLSLSPGGAVKLISYHQPLPRRMHLESALGWGSPRHPPPLTNHQPHSAEPELCYCHGHGKRPSSGLHGPMIFNICIRYL